MSVSLSVVSGKRPVARQSWRGKRKVAERVRDLQTRLTDTAAARSLSPRSALVRPLSQSELTSTHVWRIHSRERAVRSFTADKWPTGQAQARAGVNAATPRARALREYFRAKEAFASRCHATHRLCQGTIFLVRMTKHDQFHQTLPC
eukprot:431755-Pleurochrysis_carterae.AAC.1